MKYTEDQLTNLAHEFSEPGPFISRYGNPKRLIPLDFPYRLADIFKSLVNEMNKSAGCRQRKHLDTLASILETRGIKCDPAKWNDPNLFIIHLDHYQARLKYKSREGLFIILEKTAIICSEIKVPCVVHLSAPETDIADLIEAFEKFLVIAEEMILRSEDEIKRRFLVSEIMHPLLQDIIDEYMHEQGITNYNVYVSNAGYNTLDVQVVDEHWMRYDEITIANIGTLLGLIPYLISRPDRIPADGRGFKRFRKR